jgi:hypothetical protein
MKNDGYKYYFSLVVVAHAYNPSTWDAEAGGLHEPRTLRLAQAT